MRTYRFLGPKAWTAEDEAELVKLAGAGLYVSEIAKRLERSQQAVQNRAQRLKLHIKSTPTRRYSTQQTAAKSSPPTSGAAAG